jgi:uncharacterized protein YciI
MELQNLFIYRIQLNRPEILTEGATPEEEHLITQHANHLKALTDDGVALLVGRTLNTDPEAFGIVIFQANSEKEALSIMNSDPGVQRDLWKAELFPFRIAFLNEELEKTIKLNELGN